METAMRILAFVILVALFGISEIYAQNLERD